MVEYPRSQSESKRGWLATPPDPRPYASVLRWWATRIILYNAIVLPAGFLTFLGLLFLTAPPIELKSGEDMVEPLAVLGAPIALNVAYMAGPFVESIIWVVRRGRTGATGPILFRLGVGFILFVWSFAVFAPFVLPQR